jgi:uncharacterized repeat protein (TIGR03803 family)
MILLAAGATAVAQEEIVLHSFHNNGKDGWGPNSGLTFDATGNLYGTTDAGGAYDAGTIFEMSPEAGGGWTEKPLYSFKVGFAWFPSGGLLLDALGNLYGTTDASGSGYGTVFALSPKAGGFWSYDVIHYFNDNGGNFPGGGLTFDVHGNLYGLAALAAPNPDGIAWELSPAGGGNWTESVLHGFQPGGGTEPQGPLIFDADGNLYGTTNMGGKGRGTVFELSPTGDGGWTETVLHSFVNNGTDGWYPRGGLTFDAAGNLYGMTSGGGTAANCPVLFSCGTVFELSPTGGGNWTETIIHSFTETRADGFNPVDFLVIDSSGNLYGTTSLGGTYGGGTVFELTPSASGSWTETLLHSFGRAGDGKTPYAGLVLDAAGNLYGTTSAGGLDGLGTVFEITP